MKKIIIAVLLTAIIPTKVIAVTQIVCENEDNKNSITSIWPMPYISDSGLLCFDVKGWLNFSGSNCVSNGKSIRWTGLVIVTEDGESQGRDTTNFRVSKPIVNSDNIKYIIEWSRGDTWRLYAEYSHQPP